MARHSVEQEIDRLYEAALNDFTAERNALAKAQDGDDRKRIRSLPKPSTAAWAVNQLYWRDRPTYDALVDAAQRLRAAHRAVLGGKGADLRAADTAHRDALKTAIASTLRQVAQGGQQVSSALHGEISRTLEALPVEGPPGRLAKALRPGGFEALQGMPIRPAQKREAPAKTAPPPRRDKAGEARQQAEARQQKDAQRARTTARERERRDRAVVARLQKQVTAAERKATAAKAAWERALEAESTLRRELRLAEETLGRSARQLREIERDLH